MAAVGRIARAHGIRGQVIVTLGTDFPEQRFRPGAELFIERDGAVQALTLTSVRFQRDRPVIGIAGVDTMNDAEALAGHELRVPVDRLAPLPDGTFYRHDLVGCRVETLPGKSGQRGGRGRRRSRLSWRRGRSIRPRPSAPQSIRRGSESSTRPRVARWRTTDGRGDR